MFLEMRPLEDSWIKWLHKGGCLRISTGLGREACEGKQVGIGLQTTKRVLQSGGLLLEIDTKRGSTDSVS